jgi:hypothetical protein
MYIKVSMNMLELDITLKKNIFLLIELMEELAKLIYSILKIDIQQNYQLNLKIIKLN